MAEPGERKEVIAASDVLKLSGLDEKSAAVKMGSWEQQSGLKLAWAVGAVSAIVLVLLVLQWWCTSPPAPKLQGFATPDQLDYLKNYKAIADDGLERTLRAYDTLIVKPLLPIFTTLIGYVIGHGGKKH